MSDYSQEEEYARKRRLQQRRAKKRKEKVLKHLIFGIVVTLAVIATVILLILSGNPEETENTIKTAATQTTAPSTKADFTSESQTEPTVTSHSTHETTEEETTEPVSSEPTTQAEARKKGELVSNQKYAQEELLALPNKSIPYGNDWEDKDANGLANGIYYYESLYGKYGGYYRVKTDAKVIYLTMDEGFEAGYSATILDVLKEKNVKAVFFITKQFYDYCQEPGNVDLIQRMIDEGHIIGNHTCRHPSGGYPLYVDTNGLDSFTEDINKLHKLVYERYGYSMELFRFPEGESSERLLACLENYDYQPVFWSYAHRDYVMDNQPAVETTLNRCLSHLAPGAIYLLHACSSSNTEAMGDFIDSARTLGYEFGLFPIN